MGNFWGIVFGLILISAGLGAIAGINVWRYFFPTLLIVFGLSILFNQARDKTPWQGNVKQTQTSESTLDYTAVFSGIDKKVITEKFEGGKVSAVFGSATIDLREAKIVKNGHATLEVNAVFGGAKVIVPKTWAVQGDLAGVFGGFTNSTTLPEKPEATLYLKGSAVFGGGEVVN